MENALEANIKTEFLSIRKQLSQVFEEQNDIEYGIKKDKVLIVSDSSPVNIYYYSTLSKTLYKHKDLEPLVYFEKKSTEDEMLYQSLNISSFSYLEKNKIARLFIALLNTILLIVTTRNRSNFLKKRFHKVLCGDLIYDTYIREKNRYVNFKIFSFSFFKEVFKSLYKLYSYEALFEKYSIKAIILNHIVYTKMGLISRVGIKNGAEVFCMRLTSIRRYTSLNEIENQYEYTPNKKIIDCILNSYNQNKIDDYIQQRLKGSIKQHDVIEAYKNKQIYNKQTLLSDLNIKNGNPVVFIMPHAFSDATHGLSGWYLYEDYYEWYCETLKYISTIKNVNWIVKPHPSSYMYGEVGIAETQLSNYLNENIKQCPANLSTASIFSIADSVVTVGGSIGLEFAVLGKKAIICCETVYANWGIANEPKTKQEYFEMLKNIKVDALKPEKISVAKAILYWWHIGAFADSNIYPKTRLIPTLNQTEHMEMKLKMSEEFLINLKQYNGSTDNFSIQMEEMIINNEDRLLNI
jgi:hypothetical protein